MPERFERGQRSRARRFVRGAGIFACILALGLYALERKIRAGKPEPVIEQTPERAQWDSWRGGIHRASELPGVLYELVPGLEQPVYDWSVSINALGMRDGPPREGDEVLRIAAVGDSFTFGFGVSQEATWTIQLEQLLDGAPEVDGRPVDVLSFGVSGYSTRDEAVVLEHRVLDHDPDVVLLQYCINDPETRPNQPLQKFFSEPRWWTRSALLTALHDRLERRSYGKAGGYYEWLHDPDGSPWRAWTAELARIRKLCEARDIPVVLVVFPLVRPTPWDEYPFRSQHAQVISAGEDIGFITLDLLEVYERVPSSDLRLGDNDIHPNPLGHELAAEALRTLLVERVLTSITERD